MCALTSLGLGSKVVMHGTANPVFGSSILPLASIFLSFLSNKFTLTYAHGIFDTLATPRAACALGAYCDCVYTQYKKHVGFLLDRTIFQQNVYYSVRI